jgi:uncharacterized protein YndB with AHSA1/START domain
MSTDGAPEIEPLVLSFEVACPVEHAFDTWAHDIDRWWPADHTSTGEEGLTIVLEPRVSGRIYQQDRHGREVDWGEVTVWDPPRRLGYLWHLRRDRADATDVSITFEALASDLTRVRIEHRGWERLGAQGRSWRDANLGGWSTLLPHYTDVL